MKKQALIVLISVLLSACSVQNEFSVNRPGEESKAALSSFIYVLPQTVLHLELAMTKETYIPGPYHNFARSYLGITDIIDESYENWDLSSVKMKYLTEPDSANFYSINLLKGKPDFSKFLALSNQGFIIDPSKWIIQHQSGLLNYPSLIQPPYFTDLSVNDYFREITDTLYKTIITDTSFVRIPIPRRQSQPKTIEQKAEEAANFILQLREARFDLLSGEFDSFPGGEALEFAVGELNKLEKSYLELFSGKTIKQSFNASVFIIPDGKIQQFNLIDLLKNKGLKELDNYSAEDLILQIIPAQKTFSLKKPDNDDNQDINHFIYRIPDIATFRIMKGDMVYYEERATLHQAGQLIRQALID